MKNKIIALYSIFLGFSVIGMWIMLLITEPVPEGKTEMAFHLTSEIIMALLCITGGIHWLLNWKYAKTIIVVGFGMIIYSVLNAAGYYAERNNFSFVVLFIIILTVTLVAIVFLIRNKSKN